MDEWNTFFSAVASASATLTGLIFVGVSISLSRVLETKMSSRALIAILLLLTVVIIALLMLVPGQDIISKGIKILITGVAVWAITIILSLRMLYKIRTAFKVYVWLNLILTQLSVLPYIVASILMINIGGAGIYWLVSGMIFSIGKTVIDAWVLLIEIHK